MIFYYLFPFQLVQTWWYKHGSFTKQPKIKKKKRLGLPVCAFFWTSLFIFLLLSTAKNLSGWFFCCHPLISGMKICKKRKKKCLFICDKQWPSEIWFFFPSSFLFFILLELALCNLFNLDSGVELVDIAILCIRTHWIKSYLSKYKHIYFMMRWPIVFCFSC